LPFARNRDTIQKKLSWYKGKHIVTYESVFRNKSLI